MLQEQEKRISMQESSSPVDLHQNVYLLFLSIFEDGACKQTSSCAIFQKYCNRTDAEPFSNDKQFKTFWRKRFSTTLQRCNARVVLKKLSRLSDTKIDTDQLFDFDIQGQVHRFL